MQALIAGDVQRIRRDAPRAFAIYRRGITGTNMMKRIPLNRRTLAIAAVLLPWLACWSMWPCAPGRWPRWPSRW